tara:strand:+ start:564 stop:947 length:384 start_codon:yes stop_codon:yes gene_type:complete
MNTNIKTFLDNYTCEEVRPNHWEGTFTKTRTLHKLRDSLTEADWEDIKDFAAPGFWEMPPNLRNSAQQKFDKFEYWALDNCVGDYSFPTILDAAMQTSQQRYAQTLIWGVLTSCIESGYWSMQEENA